MTTSLLVDAKLLLSRVPQEDGAKASTSEYGIAYKTFCDVVVKPEGEAKPAIPCSSKMLKYLLAELADTCIDRGLKIVWREKPFMAETGHMMFRMHLVHRDASKTEMKAAS